MAKPSQFPEQLSLRVPKGTLARIRAVAFKGEDRGEVCRRLMLDGLLKHEQRIDRLAKRLEQNGK